MYNLLSVGNDAKTVKGEASGWLTGILYLSPANLSGREMCQWRTLGCTKSCLNTAGKGALKNVQQARLRKTRLLIDNPGHFMGLLDNDIGKLAWAAAKRGLRPCVRLNGTSDIPWETIATDIITRNGPVQFYDYTKSMERCVRFASRSLPGNYHLTYSRRGPQFDHEVNEMMRIGVNVAAVFDKPFRSGANFMGYSAIDGDLSDLRFLDRSPSIVWLRGKGAARNDESGFVVSVKDEAPLVAEAVSR
jgi:hypothetical protein